ncbi:MAG: DUF3990 domain-containing protein [Oscillospiraceae bacterium]|nr:DUF3990 domain-containing protein [Oscillospiraceae bacterium]
MHFVFSVANFIADDSYFQCAESFVSDTLPLKSLNMALRLGKLGEQTVVISQRGFERLKFVDIYSVDKNVYYPKFWIEILIVKKSERQNRIVMISLSEFL